MDSTAKAASATPLNGVYGFARAHLLVINAVVLASGTLVSVLDFLAPKLSVLPKVVYSATACLVILMLISACAPVVVDRLISALGLVVSRKSSGPMWRRPMWLIALAILLGVSLVGFASIAKASDGGLIASNIPAARSLQDSLLGLRQDVSDIRQGMESANGKLDKLVGDARDPQRDLVSHGYTVNGSGLMQAFKLGDKRAVALFVKIGYRVEFDGPLAVLLNGDQPWDGELAAMLPKSMFASGKGCLGQGVMVVVEGKAPVPERIETLKRLCDAAPIIQALEADIQREAGTQPANDYYRAKREARTKYLPILKG